MNHPKPQRKSRHANGEWNNNKCIEIALKDNFSSAVFDISVQKNIINRFLNFYLGGKVQQGISVFDLVYSIISIMPLHENTEEFIWDEIHYTDDGTLFFLTPEEKLKADIKNVIEKNEKANIERDSKTNGKGQNQNIDDKQGPSEAKVNTNTVKDKPGLGEGNVTNNTNTTKPIDTNPTDTKTMDSNSQSNFREGEANNHSDNHQEHAPNQMPNIPKLDDELGPAALKFPEKIKWFSDKRKRTATGAELLQYGPVDNAAFITSCDNLLGTWDNNKNARIFLKYFFGIVALTLMRSTTKSYKHVFNAFSSSKFLTTLPDILNFKYSIPHKKCVKKCYRAFSRREDISVMFAKLVVNSYRIDRKRNEQQDLRLNIFKVTVLSHTADYGLGLLSMVQTLQKASDDRINLIIEATCCESTVDSWKKLKAFVDKYMIPTTKECTHFWARVIDNEFFKDLCCSSNYPLAVILAVFIEKLGANPGIWQSTWISRGENLEIFKELGLEMYEKYVVKKQAGLEDE